MAAAHSLTSLPIAARLKSIAVFTDFSFASKLALRYGAFLAEQFGSKLSLVHSFPLPMPVYGTVDIPVIYVPEIDEEECRTKGSQLDRELDHSWTQNIDSERVVWRGSLKQFVSEHPALDLVVIGTSGQQGVHKAIFGSHAESIFRWSKVPVLTVGPQCPWPTAPVKKLVYVTDFSPQSRAAYEYALTLAERFDGELLMLHVVDGNAGAPTGDRAMAMVDPMKELQNMVPDLLTLSHRPQFLVSFGKPADTILNESAAYEADLIIMGARGAGALSSAVSHYAGGVAYAVAAASHCPVLTVRH